MRVIGDKNQISEDVFDFMISYLPFPQKSIGSEFTKLFFHQYIRVNLVAMTNVNSLKQTGRVRGSNQRLSGFKPFNLQTDLPDSTQQL